MGKKEFVLAIPVEDSSPPETRWFEVIAFDLEIIFPEYKQLSLEGFEDGR